MLFSMEKTDVGNIESTKNQVEIKSQIKIYIHVEAYDHELILCEAIGALQGVLGIIEFKL